MPGKAAKKSKSPEQAQLMRAVAHGWQPPGRHVDVGVAKEFVRGDEKKHAHKTREGRADHTREMDRWARGGK